VDLEWTLFWKLQKKLGLKKNQLNLFMVQANQCKVELVGLIQNLKINFASYVYKMSITLLNTDNDIEAYSMLLGQL
jgi:hypothetical protein